MKDIKKALTFRASSIGDCLMGKYLLENVHAQYPRARCGLVVANHGDLMRDLFAGYPWIEVIEANRKNPRALWRLWREWRGSDLVVTQYAGKPGGVFSLASKCAARLLARRGGLVGFSDASGLNNLLYDRLVPFDPQAAPAQMEREALTLAGVEVALPHPMLAPVSDLAVLRQFNLTPGMYVMFHSFSGSKKRALSVAKRQALVVALAQALPADIELVVTGGAQDKEEAIAATSGTRAKVLVERTTMQQMLALISQSRAVIAVDTGVAHMAAQLDRPVVVIGSCIGAHWWQEGQYGPASRATILTEKSACGSVHAMVDYPPCMNTIPAQKVAAAAQNFLTS